MRLASCRKGTFLLGLLLIPGAAVLLAQNGDPEKSGPSLQDAVARSQILARAYFRVGDYALSQKEYAEVLRLQTQRFSATAWQVTDARLDLQEVETLARLDGKARTELSAAEQWMAWAITDNRLGKYAEGAAHAEKALAVRQRLLGEAARPTATSAAWAGHLWQGARDWPKARQRIEQVLALRQKILGEHPDTALSQHNLGWLLHLQKDYPAAQNQYEAALAMRRKILGENHPQTTQTLHNLGLLFQDQGEHALARKYYEQALPIRQKVLGEDHLDTAWTRFNLVLTLNESEGDLARAHLEKVVAVRRKRLGNHHVDTVVALKALGVLQQHQGDYAAARSCYEQVLARHKKVLGEQHAETIVSQIDLGGLLYQQGEYAAARLHLDQGLAASRKVRGEEHPGTVAALVSLGLLLYEQGDVAAARPLMEQALALCKKTMGEDHPETATCLNNLGLLMTLQGDMATARSYHEQALRIHKKVGGESHLLTAMSLTNLGVVAQQQEDDASAGKYYEQALAIHKKVLGDNHPTTATSLGNLAEWLCRQGDSASALPLHEQALRIRKKVLGDNHPFTADSLTYLAALLYREEKYEEVRSYLEEAMAISRRSLELAAVAQSERQQLLMSALLQERFHNYLSLPWRDETAQTYTHVLRWKGAVLARQQQLRLQRQNPQMAPVVARMRSTASQLAALAFTVPDLKEQVAWKQRLAKLSRDKEDLERTLALQSRSFQQDQEIKDLTPEKLLALLPADTVLVDYLVYQHVQRDPVRKGRWIRAERLTAFVLKPGAAIVRLDLGPMEPIEKAIAEWREAFKKAPGKDHPGGVLRRQLWQPLEKHLAGARMILLAPDGALGRLPFGALPGSKEGSYLLEDVALAMIPVPRLLPQLLSEGRKEMSPTPALLLVGDVDFDADAGKADPESRTAATGPPSGTRKAWKRLPGTRGEIASIRDSYEERFGADKIKVLRGAQATETQLRALAPQHQVLHLATHGFFAPPQVRSALEADTPTRTPTRPQHHPFNQEGMAGFHPGLLSGLVLAGANHAPAEGQDDGILTALEVAELDLSQVELAVLSACETGLGKVAAGEGLLGLQRAFQIAGTKSVIASLWNVDDEATRKLMERFYENLWQKKMSRREALEQAQRAMLRGELVRGVARDDENPAPRRLPPYYWAAFVLSGDWR